MEGWRGEGWRGGGYRGEGYRGVGMKGGSERVEGGMRGWRDERVEG